MPVLWSKALWRIAPLAVAALLSVACTAAPPPATPTAPVTRGDAPTVTAAPTISVAPKSTAGTVYDPQAVAEFYRGKTFRIVVGFSAGGGFDTIYRLWGRHASKHIPGNPTVIVENMPGAGSLIAANHIFNVAPKDGTTMGAFDLFTTILGQLAGAPGIDFDATRYAWVGNPGDSSPSVCAVRSDLGFRTFSDFMRSGRELVLGASGKGNVFYATPMVARAATGAKIKVIDGYSGNPAVRLAVENRELDGACWTWASMRTTAPNWFEGDQPLMRVVLQAGSKPDPELPNVELLRDFVKDPSLLRMVEVLEHAVYHTYLAAMPPGVPADRLAAVREAWLKTWNDPELKQELARTSFRFSPVSGEETDRVVRRLLAVGPEEGKQIGQTFGLIN